MSSTDNRAMTAAYAGAVDGAFHASELTRGPWHPAHQHAGPPSALVCRAIEAAAAPHGLTHLGRFTGNLLRPVPIGALTIEVPRTTWAAMPATSRPG
jgi:hypothetical protein